MGRDQQVRGPAQSRWSELSSRSCDRTRSPRSGSRAPSAPEGLLRLPPSGARACQRTAGGCGRRGLLTPATVATTVVPGPCPPQDLPQRMEVGVGIWTRHSSSAAHLRAKLDVLEDGGPEVGIIRDAGVVDGTHIGSTNPLPLRLRDVQAAMDVNQMLKPRSRLNRRASRTQRRDGGSVSVALVCESRCDSLPIELAKLSNDCVHLKPVLPRMYAE